MKPFESTWYIYLISIIILLLGIAKGYLANKDKRLAEGIVKTVASILFVGLGICAVLYNQTAGTDTEHSLRFGLWMVAGMVLGLVGDLFMTMRHFSPDSKMWDYCTIIGSILFFLGHIMYIIALLIYDKLALGFIPCMFAMPLVFIGLILMNKINTTIPKKIFWAVYYFSINVTFAAALSLLYKSGWDFGINTPTFILFGSLVFFISDGLLAIRDRSKIQIDKPASNYAIIVTYYIAQILYAFAICLA